MIKAEKKTVHLMGILPIDAYKLETGEYRIGMASSSLAIGYAENWLSRTTSSGSKTLKALEGKGFTGYFLEVQVLRDGSGATRSKTISLDDFDSLIEWALEYGSKKSKIILKAYTRATRKRSTEDDIREAFGDNLMSVEERRALFYKEFAASLSEADWKEGDAPGADFQPSAWEIRMLSGKWQPQAFLRFRSDEEIEDFIEMKRIEFEEEV